LSHPIPSFCCEIDPSRILLLVIAPNYQRTLGAPLSLFPRRCKHPNHCRPAAVPNDTTPTIFDFVPSTGRVRHSHCTQAQAPGNLQHDFSPSPNCYKNDLTTARPHHPSTSSIKIWVRTPVCPSLFWPKPRPILATGTAFLLVSGELVAMHRRLSPLTGILLIGVTATVHSWIDVQD
jgi:hypothetical protein